MAQKNNLWGRIEIIPPIVYALVGWGVTLSLSAVLAAEWINDAVGIPLLIVAAILIVMLPAFSIIFATKLYEIDKWYLLRVIQLFIILALVFANLYFVLIVLSDPNQIYEGIHNPWKWLGGDAR